MEYRRLGHCGVKVSELCLGTMTFGHGAAEGEARQMVDLALARGVNFIDTADSYGGGQAEAMVGRALGARRRQVVLATKFFNPMGVGPNDSGMSRVHIIQALEDSLRRLQTDWVDLYYIHHVDVQVPVEEMLRALDDLVTHGKVRYIACSNYPAWRLADALWVSQVNGWNRFVAYQPQYSLVVRDIEQELVPLCLAKGLGIVAWSPLAGGFLSGAYRPGQHRAQGTRSDEDWAFPGRYFADSADQTLATLLQAASQAGCSPAQLALRWLLQRPGVTAAIVGARTAAQLTDNLGAAGWHLDDAVCTRLDQVSALPDRYPESMQKDMRARRDQAVQLPG
jgi:aryl-alcohol dehydrogenase-like predicted oxidoreductase